jgi:glycosyltransferase involved in cell wall biosynthesis
MVQKGKNISISVIGPTAPFKGGISHFNSVFCNALKKEISDVDVISWKRRYPWFLKYFNSYLAEQIDKKSKVMIKTEAVFMLDFLNPFTWWKAVKRIHAKKSDLVIFHWVSPSMALVFSFVSFFSKRMNKNKVLFICHNLKPHEGSIIDRFLTKITFSNVDSFLVHSKEDYNNLKKSNPTKNIICGFHPTYSIFSFGEKLVKKDYTNKILFFGFVRKYKGLKYLLEAMQIVLKERDIKLVVVGEFYEDKKDYLDLIEKLGIGDNVEIVDKYIPNENVSGYYSESDLLVLPYISGTQSGIIQLSFGLGVPVISTKVGGFHECVDHGKTGYLVEPKNSKALADMILEYYKENKKEAFVNNIMDMGDKFSWKNYIDLICKNLEY